MYLWGDNLKVLPSIKDNAVDLILTDPPYALTSTRVYPKDTKLSEISENLQDQVAKNTYYGATLRGFMGREWDGKLPEVQTWLECYRVLKPGGFILVMASPRNDDLVSVGLREAGFVKHNSIYHVFGSGFPKGSDCGKMIDAKAVRAWLSQHDHGLTAKEVSKVVSAAVNGEFEIPRPAKDVTGISYSKIDKTTYGINPDRTAGALLISELEEKYGSMPKRVKVGERESCGYPDGDGVAIYRNRKKSEGSQVATEGMPAITAPATPLAKEFKGMKYGIQALKPAAEVILVFQKPFEGSPLENILKWRVGCINVDAGRIATNWLEDRGESWLRSGKSNKDYIPPKSQKSHADKRDITLAERCNPQGRYPSNFLISHSPGCRVVGERRVKCSELLPEHGGQGKSNVGTFEIRDRRGEVRPNYADADGKETVRQYECVEGCAVAELDRQSGERKVGPRIRPKDSPGSNLGISGRQGENEGFGDTGTASRFFKQPEWGPADFIYQAKASSAERNSGVYLEGCLCDLLKKRTAENMNAVKIGKVKITAEFLKKRKNPLPRYLRKGSWLIYVANDHPTIKPISLAVYLINLYCGHNPNPVVGDFFAGTGWVEVAGILTGVKTISIEADLGYVQLGEGRARYWTRNKQNYLTEGRLPKYQPDLPLFETEE